MLCSAGEVNNNSLKIKYSRNRTTLFLFKLSNIDSLAINYVNAAELKELISARKG